MLDVPDAWILWQNLNYLMIYLSHSDTLYFVLYPQLNTKYTEILYRESAIYDCFATTRYKFDEYKD